MKEALCIRSLKELSELVSGERETIDSQMVDRAVCEIVENGYLQVIPYVVFYTTDISEGKVRFVQYLRAATGGEDRLLSKTSIGFGGHIDASDELKFGSSTDIDGVVTYSMSLNDIVETTIGCGVREIIEELGSNLFETLGIKVIAQNTAFFMGNPEEEVNKVHLGLLIPVKLTQEQLNILIKEVVINKDEISSIDVLGININTIIEEMDVTITLNKIENELSYKLNLEDWSCKAMSFIVKKEINSLMKNVSYTDIVSLIHMKEEEEKISDVVYSVDPETKAVTKVQEQSEAEDLEEQCVAPV